MPEDLQKFKQDTTAANNENLATSVKDSKEEEGRGINIEEPDRLDSCQGLQNKNKNESSATESIKNSKRIDSMFSQVLSLAKAKLVAKKGPLAFELTDIFEKFENRNGIANSNEAEYKTNALLQVPIKSSVKREEPEHPLQTQNEPAQIELSQKQTEELRQQPLVYIPNQPSVSLADTIKKNFPR